MSHSKRQKLEEAKDFQSPFTMIDNLEVSAKSMQSTNTTLTATLSLLNQVRKEFSRQTSLAKYTRHHELVAGRELERAQEEVSKEIKPELDALMNDANILLSTLKLEEDELTAKLEEQERYIKDLRATAKHTYRTHNTSSSSSSSSSTSQPIFKEPLSTGHTLELEKLKKERSRLAQLNELEEQKLLKETKELKAIQRENLQVERQLEMAKAPSNESDLDKQKRKQELKQELENLRSILVEKEKEYQKRKQQPANKRVEHTTQETKTVPITQYKSHLELIQSTMESIRQPNFVASQSSVKSCETQCRRYLQALQKEVSLPPPNPEVPSKAVQQIKSLCKALFSDHVYGKTAGRILEILLLNPDTKIPIEELVEEFPSTKEKRHHFTNVTLVLLKANIIEFSGKDMVLKISL